MSVVAPVGVDAGGAVVLTAHPLQRIGAFALAKLAGVGEPGLVDEAGLAAAVAVMTGDAVRAALGRDTKAEGGFFLKSSLSLYPNSPMFHPSNAKRSNAELEERVRAWRECPARQQWPAGVVCVLCARPAVGFFGKMDVPLAESDAYRNSTPRRHEGMALCWGCLCCFYALPYGVRLTGGPCLAVHSWDDAFLQRMVSIQVLQTRQSIAVGAAGQEALRAREVLALRRLRGYERGLWAGVELLVVSNNNRGPSIDIHALDQDLAEWLRATMTRERLRGGFVALLRAHRSADTPGQVGLARNAFRAPARVVGAGARYLSRVAFTQRRPDPRRWDEVPDLALLCFDYAVKVMQMDKDDLEEIKSTARRVVAAVGPDLTAGRLREFYTLFKQPDRLRARLQKLGVEWALRPREAEVEPLLTTRAFGLLFDPDFDNRAWFHRQLFLVAVVEQLHASGWRPPQSDDKDIEALPDLDDGPDREDQDLAGYSSTEDDQ